jgi:hypothetical protein
VKTLSTWDTYVTEATSVEDRRIQLPITDDEVYVLEYPTRRQGKEILAAQRRGDVDAMLVALLGEQAGARIAELSNDEPGFVVDHFLVDVMRKFGMIPEDESTADVMDTVTQAAISLVRDTDPAEEQAPDTLAATIAAAATAGARAAAKVAAAAKASPGKGGATARRSTASSRKATTTSSRSRAASS